MMITTSYGIVCVYVVGCGKASHIIYIASYVCTRLKSIMLLNPPIILSGNSF